MCTDLFVCVRVCVVFQFDLARPACREPCGRDQSFVLFDDYFVFSETEMRYMLTFVLPFILRFPLLDLRFPLLQIHLQQNMRQSGWLSGCIEWIDWMDTVGVVGSVGLVRRVGGSAPSDLKQYCL